MLTEPVVRRRMTAAQPGLFGPWHSARLRERAPAHRRGDRGAARRPATAAKIHVISVRFFCVATSRGGRRRPLAAGRRPLRRGRCRPSASRPPAASGCRRRGGSRRRPAESAAAASAEPAAAAEPVGVEAVAAELLARARERRGVLGPEADRVDANAALDRVRHGVERLDPAVARAVGQEHDDVRHVAVRTGLRACRRRSGPSGASPTGGTFGIRLGDRVDALQHRRADGGATAGRERRRSRRRAPPGRSSARRSAPRSPRRRRGPSARPSAGSRRTRGRRPGRRTAGWARRRSSTSTRRRPWRG